MANQSVESFSMSLSGWESVLNADKPADLLEEKIRTQLDAPVRLLRWAVVRVDGSRFQCEGAYLKKTG